MNSFNIHQNPYGHHDAQEAAEQHYLRKADRERNRRVGETRNTDARSPPQVGAMSQSSLPGAQEATKRLAQMETSKLRRIQSQRRTQLPQTTYSPFPTPKPLMRKPVSKERQRTDSPSSVLSFASNGSKPQIAHERSRPVDMNSARPPQTSPSSSSRPNSPTPTPRPSSPNPSIFNYFTPSRRGSNASSTAESSRPRSRRGSISETVRRASTSLTNAVDIVKMSPHDRARWRVSEKARMEQELEDARRVDPSLRPQYQQEYLSWKAKHVAASQAAQEMDEHDRTIALDAALRSKSGKGKVEAQKERDALAPLTAGEEIALLVSKAVDPLRRRKRANSDDSGMDFADCGAPADVMECCKRCGRPVGGSEEEGLFLTGGYCPRCHRLRTQGQ